MEFWEASRKLSPSSSALIALASLTPPSPILCSTQLSATCTSGYIPILLSSFDRVSTLSIHDSYPGSEANLGLGIFPSSSTRTIETVGTFGPTRRNLKYRGSAEWSPTTQTSWEDSKRSIDDDLTFSTPLGSTSTALQNLALPEGHYSPRCPVAGSSSAIYPHTSPLSDIRFVTDQEDVTNCSAHADYCNESPNINISQTMLSPSKSISDAGDLQGIVPSRTFSTRDCLAPHQSLSIPPSESCPSSPRLRIRSRLHSGSPGKTEALVDRQNILNTGVEVVLDPHCSYGSDSAPCTPQVPHFYLSPRNHSCDSDTVNSPQSGRQTSMHGLPRNLTWLSNTVVEVLIDQEGFRTVQPRFKFIGYSSQRPLASHRNNPDGGLVQFRPTARQVFKFHYAPFDGLPVLRRVTINRDDSRDYISRQASLSLKSNGVYTVRGNETSSLPMPSLACDDSRHGLESKLHWSFEYLVDDRRVETSGKLVDGEKTLTPLTFSCSPTLLHPLQGKRIRLLHVVKKSVAPKLVAEKMEPPVGRPAKAVSSSFNITRNCTLPKNDLPSTTGPKSHIWNVHRRAKSHAPQFIKNETGYSGRSVLHLHGGTTIQEKARQPNTGPGLARRRRRASSAGEWSHIGDPADAEPHTQPSIIDCDAVPYKLSPTVRHIISRSRLAEMFRVETEDTGPPPGPAFSHQDVLGFRPLTPSPRHYQARARSGERTEMK